MGSAIRVAPAIRVAAAVPVAPAIRWRRSGGAGDPGGAGSGGDSGGASEPAKAPPRGWQVPEDAPAGGDSDLDPFLTLVQALRDLIPPELQRRLVAALRELLLALRALIDWYLERLERRREQGVEVQDIPIL